MRATMRTIDSAPSGRATSHRKTAASPPRTSGMADPRIEPAVGEVNDQGHEDDHERDDENIGLQLRIVSRRDRSEREPAGTRHRESRLDEDGTAQQIAELDAEDRDHRDHGVLERVAHEHGPLTQTLRIRRADIVLMYDLEHGRAGHSHRDRREVSAEGDRGDGELLKVAPGILDEGDVRDRRYPAEPDREVQEHEGADPEARHRQARDAHDPPDVIRPRTRAHGRDHADGYPEAEGDDEREYGELDGHRQRTEQLRQHRLIADEGRPEVASENVRDPAQILLRKRSVETQSPPRRFEIRDMARLLELHEHGIPWDEPDETRREQ